MYFMVKVIIKNLNDKVVDLAPCKRSLLHCLLEQGMDWMHACGGKGRCTTCKVQVIGGMEQLSPLSHSEINYRKQSLLSNDERLSCQVVAKGDIVVRVPKEGQLPHLHYSE
jgi:2Fe-2S ferredoxin